MSRTYATVDEFRAYIGNVNPDCQPSQAALRRASRVIDRMLIGAFYDTDAEGYPTDEGYRDAVREATCHLVAFWHEIGDGEGFGAVAPVASESLLGASVTYATGNDSRLAGTPRASVADPLYEVGLLPVRPFVDG